MRKVTFVFAALGLFLYFSQASYAQRGGGVGRGPSIGATHAGSHFPGASPSEGRSQGDVHANAGAPASDHNKPNTKVADAVQRNPQLSSRLEALLPAGMTLTDAAAGFKNQGQFIAALHVSKNLGIPFADLKAKMTGDSHESLGQSIHELRPDLNESQAKDEAKKGESQAKTDVAQNS